MRILLISYWFPPYNTIGAVRLGKTAKYLTTLGHDLRILTASGQEAVANLGVEVDGERISYSEWYDILHLKHVDKTSIQTNTTSENVYTERTHGKLYKLCRNAFVNTVAFPDNYIGWYPYAIKEGMKVCANWKPDIIYASALPYTSLLVAKKIADNLKTPWVAELRDLWTDNNMRGSYGLRNILERHLEKNILGSAQALVTVSEPLVKTLQAKYKQPVACIMNGYDPEDYCKHRNGHNNTDKLNIGYFGNLYQGKRNPLPLFEALRYMGDERKMVEVHFYGHEVSYARECAAKYGIGENVKIHPEISYSESISMQMNSDILLLLLWDGKKEKGIVTGKLFEYIGARRPILCIGCDDGAAANIVNNRNVGFVSSYPFDITAQLRKWVDEKKATGDISLPKEANLEGFTRKDQAYALSKFLESILADNPGK